MWHGLAKLARWHFRNSAFRVSYGNMKPEFEPTKMPSEQQRIAIAKASGWTRVASQTDAGFEIKNPAGEVVFQDSDPTWYWPVHVLPAYDESLDAMREAELTLGESQLREYQDALVSVCDRAGMPRILLASAAQRAEAFLVALGKWIIGIPTGKVRPALPEHAIVRVLRDFPDDGVFAGDSGTIVAVYGGGVACEVEFIKDDRSTVVTIEAGDVALVKE